MKIGYTLWTWLMDEYNDWKPYSPDGKRDFEQSLREVSDLGYEVFENFNVLVNLYEDAPTEFSELVAKYGVAFVSLYHYLTADFDTDMKMADRCCKFLATHNANIMNIQAPGAPSSGTTEIELREVVEKLTVMGKLTKEYGVSLCLHPHYGTMVYLEHEIDCLVERVDPDLLSLCMDTAHTSLAGMDTVAAFTKYINRIRYIHLKDLDPNYPEKTPMRGFRALGEGTINFGGIVDAIRKAGYDGVLTVECDYQRVCNYETAMVSRKYIHNVLGM